MCLGGVFCEWLLVIVEFVFCTVDLFLVFLFCFVLYGWWVCIAVGFGLLLEIGVY